MAPSRRERLEQDNLRRFTLGMVSQERNRTGRVVAMVGSKDMEDPYGEAETAYAESPADTLASRARKELVNSDTADSVEGAALHASRAAALASLAVFKASCEEQAPY